MILLISSVFLLSVIVVSVMFARDSKKQLANVKPTTQPAKPPSQATVKPQAPTEEELMAMSDTELLRKIAMHSERVDNHLLRIRMYYWSLFAGFCAWLFVYLKNNA